MIPHPGLFNVDFLEELFDRRKGLPAAGFLRSCCFLSLFAPDSPAMSRRICFPSKLTASAAS